MDAADPVSVPASSFPPPPPSGVMPPPPSGVTAPLGVPRLPEPVPQPASFTGIPGPSMVAGVQELGAVSSRSRKKRGPRFGPIVAAVIVVGGGLGAAAFATGYFDASAPGLAAEPVPTAVATEVSSGVDADAQQQAAPATVVVNSPPTTSGPPAVREAQVLVDVAELEQQMADQVALRDRCRLEHNTVFVSIQAFMNQTGSTPSHPDVLVNSGWLEAHPEGWSPRWQWDISDLGLAVVPVPGTLCDV